MVSTLDFESSDPSSNLGGTFIHKIFFSSPAAAWSGDAYGFQPVTELVLISGYGLLIFWVFFQDCGF